MEIEEGVTIGAVLVVVVRLMTTFGAKALATLATESLFSENRHLAFCAEGDDVFTVYLDDQAVAIAAGTWDGGDIFSEDETTIKANSRPSFDLGLASRAIECELRAA